MEQSTVCSGAVFHRAGSRQIISSPTAQGRRRHRAPSAGAARARSRVGSHRLLVRRGSERPGTRLRCRRRALRRARPRRQDDPAMRDLADLAPGNRIGKNHRLFSGRFRNHLRHVEGEGIVVVDNDRPASRIDRHSRPRKSLVPRKTRSFSPVWRMRARPLTCRATVSRRSENRQSYFLNLYTFK